MFRRLLCALFAALLVPCFASADDDDHVMGNYQGSFVGDAKDAAKIRAEVVALGKTSYRAVFFVGYSEDEMQRVEIKGNRENETSPVHLEGEVDLAGVNSKITATIENEKMTGTVVRQPDQGDFELKRVFLQSPTLDLPAPEGAVVLFDGKNMDNFKRTPEDWCLQPDGWVEVCSSSWMTTQEFGPAKYHIEFMTPFMPDQRDQGRGNSGVYILGRYEVQVLDSFGDLPADNLCGGIYKKAVPTSQACYPPLQAQTYDITFYPAEFDQSGRKTRDAVINVVLNGVTIHDNVTLTGPTPGGVGDQDAATGPLMLQDHHNSVKYRNIWVQPLNK